MAKLPPEIIINMDAETKNYVEAFCHSINKLKYIVELIADITKANIKAQGMTGENAIAKYQNNFPPYNSNDFDMLIDEFSLSDIKVQKRLNMQ